jgi:hypothetical protein
MKLWSTTHHETVSGILSSRDMSRYFNLLNFPFSSAKLLSMTDLADPWRKLNLFWRVESFPLSYRVLTPPKTKQKLSLPIYGDLLELAQEYHLSHFLNIMASWIESGHPTYVWINVTNSMKQDRWVTKAVYKCLPIGSSSFNRDMWTISINP